MTRKITLAGIFIAQAMVLGFLERLIPFNIGIPGIKLGLANIITLTSLFLLGPAYAIIIQLGRVILSAFLFGNAAGLVYSLAGGILSVAAMIFLYKLKKPLFSIVAISVFGAAFHNIGQISAAALFVKDLRIAYYLPVLMLSSVATGLFVGFTCKYLVKGLLHINLFSKTDKNISNRL